MSYEDPTFFELLCERSLAIRILFGVSLMFFVLSFPLLFFYEWGSANSVVTVFNVVGSAAFMSVTYYTIRKCREL
jgi:hypothetical protein